MSGLTEACPYLCPTTVRDAEIGIGLSNSKKAGIESVDIGF